MIEFFLRGDFRYFWPENIGNFAHFPLAWDSSLNTGIGQSQIGSLWIISYFNFTLLFSRLGLSWNWISLLFWILPAIFLSFLSSFFLFKYLFKEKIKYSLLAGIIYTFNTYFLIILTGGQLGVCLAYSLAPLVLLRSIKIIEDPSLINVLISGLILGLQLIFDPRIVYVTLIAIFIYLFLNLSKLKTLKNKLSLLTPFIIAALLNIFFLLPLILTKNSPLPEGFNSIKGFEFFSFADFSHSLSLLHPNWPENIFGKVYFLKPEFLILPIIAFSALLFTKNKTILFFSFLALLGSFLAKGANPPFGQINIWLFQSFPGMSMFRDPTKFYILVALSYSMLIPFSISSIQGLIKSKMQSKYQIFNFSYVFLIFAILYLLFLLSPVFGQVKFHQVPKEYAQLKNFLDSQKTFSRTLWIPEWQRFGYFSNNHPAIGRREIFKGDAKSMIGDLNNPEVPSLMSDLSVKYVIVPYDSLGEIFIKDRKYDNSQYQNAVIGLAGISWLKKIEGFGGIAIFEMANPRDHFFSVAKNIEINYEFVSPVKYIVNLKNVKKGDVLVFSEGFDGNWKAIGNFGQIKSERFDKILNSFKLSQDGSYNLEVYYNPQAWVNVGLLISIAAFISILGFLKFGKTYKK